MMPKDEIERLFRSNYRPMFALAMRLLRDSDAAHDVVHDVFCGLIENPAATVNTVWLLGAVRFRCLKHLRSLTVRERFEQTVAFDLTEIEDGCWPDEAEFERIRAVVAELPDKTRAVLELKFVSRMKYREIAQKLAISEAAVYKQLRNALNVLRKNFHRDE